MEEPVVRLKSVTKKYHEGERERTVLNDASLEIRRGEWLFLVGRSGSGKSTLLNLISGMDLPDTGEVEVEGRVLNNLSEHERTLLRRERIGFVFQFFNLIPTLTVMENILLPLELVGNVGRRERERAADLLEHVQLGDRSHSFPDNLSGGEQQRVAVARALIHGPAILLADEPTGNLDSDTGGQVLDLITSLSRASGTTLVAVTHSNEIARIAHRRFTITDGYLHEISNNRYSG